MLLDMNRYSNEDIELCWNFVHRKLDPAAYEAAKQRMRESEDLFLLAAQLTPEPPPDECNEADREFDWNVFRRKSGIRLRTRSPIQALLAGPADPDVVESEECLRDALMMESVDQLEALISEDLILVGYHDSITSKASLLDAVRSQRLVHVGHEPRSFRVRQIRKDVAMTVLEVDLILLIDHEEATGGFRYSHVWAREGATWRLEHGHVSRMVSE